MRVIAGSARRIHLNTVAGMDVRPTTDRIKETLFNIIAGELYDCSFLDLFSGSGAIGIEALSRGAREAVFVDKNKASIACIEDNLKRTHLRGKAQVIQSDCISSIDRLSGLGRRFDLIFMDPPYGKSLERDVLGTLSRSKAADKQTLIIIEASLGTDFSYLESYGYDLVRTKEYKTNMHIFVRKS